MTAGINENVGSKVFEGLAGEIAFGQQQKAFEGPLGQAAVEAIAPIVEKYGPINITGGNTTGGVGLVKAPMANLPNLGTGALEEKIKSPLGVKG
jgi:hypothetical protein